MIDYNPIDYVLFGRSIKYYEAYGFQLIEVPWWVSWEVMSVTAPHGVDLSKSYIPMADKYLVASAEQSFLQMMFDGKLTKGKYMAITPCFRDDMEDELHQKYFMKLELIVVDPRNADSEFNAMINQANRFFNDLTTYRQLPSLISEYGSGAMTSTIISHHCHQVSVDDPRSIVARDILLQGIEIGSYGIRKYHKDERTHTWVYGTGLAEPRFSTVLSVL